MSDGASTHLRHHNPSLSITHTFRKICYAFRLFTRTLSDTPSSSLLLRPLSIPTAVESPPPPPPPLPTVEFLNETSALPCDTLHARISTKSHAHTHKLLFTSIHSCTSTFVVARCSGAFVDGEYFRPTPPPPSLNTPQRDRGKYRHSTFRRGARDSDEREICKAVDAHII
ncbi:hypothetical protein ACI65C_003378 [Semiaphis heraclei]